MRIRYTPTGIRSIGNGGEDGEGRGLFLLSYPWRISRPEDAGRLRLAYRDFHRRKIKKASLDRRRILANPSGIRQGQPEYRIRGVVADAAFLPDGRLERICITQPKVMDDGSHSMDTHLWLMADRLHADPTRIKPYSGLGNDLLTVSLGDTIALDATLTAYDDKTGRHRLGIDRWTPVESQLEYIEIQSETLRHRIAPRNACGQLAILHIGGDGAWTGVTEWDWTDELDGWLDRHPDIQRLGYLTPEEES